MEYWDTHLHRASLKKLSSILKLFQHRSLWLVQLLRQEGPTRKMGERGVKGGSEQSSGFLPPSRNSILQMIAGQKWYLRFKRWAKCATAVVSTTKDTWSNIELCLSCSLQLYTQLLFQDKVSCLPNCSRILFSKFIQFLFLGTTNRTSASMQRGGIL